MDFWQMREKYTQCCEAVSSSASEDLKRNESSSPTQASLLYSLLRNMKKSHFENRKFSSALLQFWTDSSCEIERTLGFDETLAMIIRNISEKFHFFLKKGIIQN